MGFIIILFPKVDRGQLILLKITWLHPWSQPHANCFTTWAKAQGDPHLGYCRFDVNTTQGRKKENCNKTSTFANT